MTDLIDKWKKGELELDKNYYIELEDGTIEIQMFVGGFLCKEDNGVKEVLAPVPSYEEFDNITKCYLCAHEKADRLEKENKKLKALLKEVRGKLKYINTPRNNHNIFGNDLMKKINQTLGDKNNDGI